MTERRTKLFVILAVWLSFLMVSLASAPIPGVNESHYLTKSKHYWNPDWCVRDFFLTSFSAHQVFYQTCGWLTLWLDLTSVALVGRLLGMALLAAGWTAMVSRLMRGGSNEERSTADDPAATPSPRASLWNVLLSAWLFLGLQAVGNLSGEWLVGGFESKIVAYAFVFFAIAMRLDRRFNLAAVCSGAAITFHPLVGLWHVVAMCFAKIADFRFQIADFKSQISILKIPFLLTTISALPGLWPVMRMLGAADSRTSLAANFVQVFYRLKHHLDPMDFGLCHYVGYFLLAAVWFGLLQSMRKKEALSPSDRWWIAYLAATTLFAVGGFLAGVGPRPAQEMWGYRWRMGLMKFYPFRLFDLMLPVAVAALAPRVFACFKLGRERPARLVGREYLLWTVATLGLGWAVAEVRLFEPAIPWTRPVRADWLDACRWIAANTPADALFLTPIESDSFKWHAQRAEFVNFKDCPQDAAGIVEWNRRLQWIERWSKAGFADERYSVDELRELRRKTGAEFAMARLRVPYESDLIYSNDTFNVFRLPEVK